MLEIRGLQYYPQMAGVATGFHSTQAGITADSTCLISSSWSPINYQMCLLLGWYESLQPDRPFAHKIEDPYYRK